MLCKHAYPHLRECRGCIVNVSSMAGVQGERHHAVYAATKGALNAMTKSMAVDYVALTASAVMRCVHRAC